MDIQTRIGALIVVALPLVLTVILWVLSGVLRLCSWFCNRRARMTPARSAERCVEEYSRGSDLIDWSEGMNDLAWLSLKMFGILSCALLFLLLMSR